MGNYKLDSKTTASRRFPIQFLRDWAGAALDHETGELVQCKQLLKNPKHREACTNASATEIGRLAQGLKGGAKGTSAMTFIQKEDAPHDRKRDVTYGNFACDCRPQKEEKERVRLALGGD